MYSFLPLHCKDLAPQAANADVMSQIKELINPLWKLTFALFLTPTGSFLEFTVGFQEWWCRCALSQWSREGPAWPSMGDEDGTLGWDVFAENWLLWNCGPKFPIFPSKSRAHFLLPCCSLSLHKRHPTLLLLNHLFSIRPLWEHSRFTLWAD